MFQTVMSEIHTLDIPVFIRSKDYCKNYCLFKKKFLIKIHRVPTNNADKLIRVSF